MWSREVALHEEELVERLRLRTKAPSDRFGNVWKTVKKILSYEIQILPTAPRKSTTLALAASGGLAEILRALLGTDAAPSGSLVALILGFFAANGLERFRQKRRIGLLITLVTARILGVHILFFPIIWLASCFNFIHNHMSPDKAAKAKEKINKTNIDPPPIFGQHAWVPARKFDFMK